MKPAIRNLALLAGAAWLLTRDRSATAGEPEFIEYTVKPGESLSVIARDWLGDANRWAELAALNAISDPRQLRAGQVILLPPDASVSQGA